MRGGGASILRAALLMCLAACSLCLAPSESELYTGTRGRRLSLVPGNDNIDNAEGGATTLNTSDSGSDPCVALPAYGISWGGTCAAGQQQSPVDISGAVQDTALRPLATAWLPAPSYYVQLRRDAVRVSLELPWPDGSTIALPGTAQRLTLRQLHFHAPSDHAVDGVQYPLEAHLVSTSDDGTVDLVIGLFFVFGAFNPVVDALLSHAPTAANTQTLVNTPLDLYHPAFAGGINTESYFAYTGSLTTPPCTEGVLWRLLMRERTVAPSQLDRLRRALAAVQFSQRLDRVPQPLNGRTVSMFLNATDFARACGKTEPSAIESVNRNASLLLSTCTWAAWAASTELSPGAKAGISVGFVVAGGVIAALAAAVDALRRKIAALRAARTGEGASLLAGTRTGTRSPADSHLPTPAGDGAAKDAGGGLSEVELGTVRPP